MDYFGLHHINGAVTEPQGGTPVQTTWGRGRVTGRPKCVEIVKMITDPVGKAVGSD